MKARQLLANKAYNSETVKIMSKAFEDAWEIIGPTISQRPEAFEAARIQLANIILGLAKDSDPTAEQITCAAVQLMPNPKNISRYPGN